MNIKTTSSKSNWTDLLQKAVCTKDRTPQGDNWKTMLELSRESGYSRAATLRRITTLLSDGKVERFRGSMGGHIQFWYKIK